MSQAERSADVYRKRTTRGAEDWNQPAETIAALIDPGGSVLEIGSGPGYDAGRLEALGLRVRRTDATRAFVAMQRAEGHDADVLDVRLDDPRGPGGETYDAILANAVLLHIDRGELSMVLARLLTAVRPGGVLVATFKEGDGEEWSRHKVDLPRHFVYWRSGPLAVAVANSGWELLRVESADTRWGPWLTVVARRSTSTDTPSTASPMAASAAPTTAGAV